MVYKIAMLISHLFPATLQGLIKIFMNVYVLWIWGALRSEIQSKPNEKKGLFPSTWY